jgi:hypothetical protein
MVYWRTLSLSKDGSRRIAFNLQLFAPETLAGTVVDYFDGFKSFDDLPRDGHCVTDMWF